ncbi:MAG: energy transducer TonB [Sulfurimonas sp.]|nr:energy transducer TonB [Sulfurimonas sp.]
MSRYVSSFLISSTIYAATIATLFYFLNSERCEAKSEMESTKVVKVSLLNLQQEEPKEAKAPTTSEPKKEIKKEPIAKTEPKKIIKEIPLTHFKATPLEEPKQEQFAKEEKTENTVSKTTSQNNENSIEKKEMVNEELEEKQNSFFAGLRERINKNKSYPESARRRGVQGDIEMKFCILENGNVENIELLSGKSIFEKSAIEAIEKSFPIKVDKTLFTFPKEFKITIAYILKGNS